VKIEAITAAAYRIPTDQPEGDGTYQWDSTTLVTVQVRAGPARGFGYSYTTAAAAGLIRDQLGRVVIGRDPLAIEAIWNALLAEVRNLGRPGIAATAISALDAALWDLKAKLLDLPLCVLLGQVRDSVPVYGSGGFTTYSVSQLCAQLVGWAERGITLVKMKVGAHPDQDESRVRAVRDALAGHAALMVDANGAFRLADAIRMADRFGELAVTWFEEPVSSDDLYGLRQLCDRAPPGLAIAAGEYGYDSFYFLRMLQAGAVHVLQADATRCLGITGLLNAGRLCQAFQVPLSTHTAPSLHAHAGCALTPLLHLEYFHDHSRIEEMLFDGFLHPRNGALHPDLSRPGIGVELKEPDAARFAA